MSDDKKKDVSLREITEDLSTAGVAPEPDEGWHNSTCKCGDCIEKTLQAESREKKRRGRPRAQLLGVARKPSPVKDYEAGYPERVMAHLILVHEWTVDGIVTVNIQVTEKGVNAIELKDEHPFRFMSEMASRPGISFKDAKKNLLADCLEQWPEFFQLWIDGGL